MTALISSVSDFVFLDEAETADTLSMRDAVDIVRQIFDDVGRGGSYVSNPTAMFLSGDASAQTHFKVKGAYVRAFDVCGFRIAGDVGISGERHYCYLVDPATAAPAALVAQTHLHRLRTAACGLYVARTLCDRDNPSVALIGTGRIGACLAEGFREIFPKGPLRLAGRQAKSAYALAEKINDPDIYACNSPTDAAAGADIVIALSAAREPVISPDVLHDGVTVIGMGEHHELPHGLLDRADRFFVDEFDFATVVGSLAEWIRLKQVDRSAACARLTGTIGDIVAGKVVGRRDQSERILAIVQGLAVADIAFSEVCRRRAIQASIS